MTLRLTVMMAETRRTSREGVPEGAEHKAGGSVLNPGVFLVWAGGQEGKTQGMWSVSHCTRCAVSHHGGRILGFWAPRRGESDPKRFLGAQFGALILTGTLGALARPAKATAAAL